MHPCIGEEGFNGFSVLIHAYPLKTSQVWPLIRPGFKEDGIHGRLFSLKWNQGGRMRISIIAVGKIRDRWIRDGIDEYAGRLRRFGRLDIIEVADEKVPDGYSEKEVGLAMEKEGERILSRWPADAWAAALSPRGDQLGSEGLSRLMDQRMISGTNHFLFVIGGSNGLSEEVLKKGDRRLSFGGHTFPHQLFRVMLLEQIYRGMKIRAGETYHK